MGRTPFYRTWNDLEQHFFNIERTQTCSCIGDRTRTAYIFLATNDQRSNFEYNRAFTRFTKSLNEVDSNQTSFFQTSNKLKHVHLLVIELEHPIFGFEHCSTHHYTTCT